MRQILYVAAAAVLAMLLFRGLRRPELVAPPDDPWFQSTVVQPSHQKPVVVKFGATWCGPCRMLEAELDQLVQQHHGRLQVVQVDVNEQPELAQHFRVNGIPDTMLFSDGRAVGREIGFVSAADLTDWVAPWLK